MKKTILLFTLLCALWACSSDSDDNAKDMTYPEITDKGITANPIDCQQYKRGETIYVCYQFSDNQALGNYNIEIHNNFDHHTHGTTHTDCPMDANKEPVKPFVFNQDYTIPAGSKSYTAKVEIPIPADADAGDYHFMIRLTDAAGWQQIKSVSIKVLE